MLYAFDRSRDAIEQFIVKQKKKQIREFSELRRGKVEKISTIHKFLTKETSLKLTLDFTRNHRMDLGNPWKRSAEKIGCRSGLGPPLETSRVVLIIYRPHERQYRRTSSTWRRPTRDLNLLNNKISDSRRLLAIGKTAVAKG